MYFDRVRLSSTSRKAHGCNPPIFIFILIYILLKNFGAWGKPLMSNWKKYAYLCHLGFCSKCFLRAEMSLSQLGELLKPLLILVGEILWFHGALKCGTFGVCDLWLVASLSHYYFYVMRHISIKWACPPSFLSVARWRFLVGLFLRLSYVGFGL